MSLIKSVLKLHKNPKDLNEIFEIMRILNKNSHKKNYMKLLNTDDGGKIAYERVELEEKLSNVEWLDKFPQGTLGAAYREWTKSKNIGAKQLADVSLDRVTYFQKKHPYIWTARKIRDVHDIWHVLCGYGTDKLGESCLVAFTYKQTGGPGWLLVACNAIVTSLLKGKKLKWKLIKAVNEGFSLGKKAKYLLAVDYEELFSKSLEEARVSLCVGTPVIYKEIMLSKNKLQNRKSQ